MKRFALITAALLFSLALFQGKQPKVNAEDSKEKTLIVHEWGVLLVDGATGKFMRKGDLPEFVIKVPSDLLAKAEPIKEDDIKDLEKRIKDIEKIAVPAKPIIYFYSDEAQTLDCKVDFNLALPFCWWPESEFGSDLLTQIQSKQDEVTSLEKQLEESKVNIRGRRNQPKVQEDLNKAKQDLNNLKKQLQGKKTLEWKNVELKPQSEARCEEVDKKSWFNQARDVDACTLSVGKTEEKFLFYEGFGSGQTPGLLTADDISITFENTGKESLKDIFVLRIIGGRAFLETLKELPAGEKKVWETKMNHTKTDREYRDATINALKARLIDAGMYEKEAEGLLKIWGKDFFAEEGTRVIYRVSQEQTEAWWPLTLSKTPDELKRVTLVCVEPGK